MERSLFRKTKDQFPLLFAFLLLGLGFYIYRIYLQENLLFSVILFANSTVSMVIALSLWRSFSEKYAHEIIYWTTNHKIARKFVAGGSFSYYEYQENIHKIGIFQPIFRFINLMLSFLSLAASFASIFKLSPESPVSNINSVWVWSLLIIIVPVILTPIIPIIWTMEDLQLKSWNEKWKTNVRVSRRYKARFNSIIAIGALGTAFTLGQNPELQFIENLQNFGRLLFTGSQILTYPISVLTLLYYIYFRERVRKKVKDKLQIPMAETKLIYRNEKGEYISKTGEIIFDSATSEDNREDVIAASIVATKKDAVPSKEEEIEEISESDESKNVPQKVGDAIVDTGKSIISGISSVGKTINDNTIGRIFKKRKERKIEKQKLENRPKKVFKSGSATEDLWLHDDDEDSEDNYKYTGGSATKGLWDNEEKDENDDK